MSVMLAQPPLNHTEKLRRYIGAPWGNHCWLKRWEGLVMNHCHHETGQATE
jgi:hypothetical protein